jgi:tellurite methyltransferase
MTIQDREKWDARYLTKPGGSKPSMILKKYWMLAPCGNALDIACGNGRNSLFLAEKGFVVDAVDISTVATGHLAGRRPNIHVICEDLDTWKIPQDRYELIINVRFLDRRLFPMIQRGLRTGGVLIFEAFIGEKNHDYYLKPNELLRAFASLHIIHYEEKESNPSEKYTQTASLVGIKEPG